MMMQPYTSWSAVVCQVKDTRTPRGIRAYSSCCTLLRMVLFVHISRLMSYPSKYRGKKKLLLTRQVAFLQSSALSGIGLSRWYFRNLFCLKAYYIDLILVILHSVTRRDISNVRQWQQIQGHTFQLT